MASIEKLKNKKMKQQMQKPLQEGSRNQQDILIELTTTLLLIANVSSTVKNSTIKRP